MIHIGWYSRDEYLDFYADLSKYMVSTDISKFRFSHVTHSEKEKKKLFEKYNFNNPIYNLNSYLRKNWNSFDISINTFNQLESTYGFPSLSSYILADYFIHKLNYHQILNLLVGHIRFFEEYFEKEKPDYFVSERGSILSTNVAWAVCQRYNVTFLCFAKLPIENCFYISSNRSGFPTQLKEEYARFKKNDLSLDEDKKVTKFINDFCQNPKKTSDIIFRARKPKITWNMRKFIKWLPEIVTYYTDRPYYIYKNPVNGQIEHLGRVLKYRLYKALNIFEKADYSKKYVLYPLHRMTEWSMHVSAPFTYADQISVISNIALSLPLDHELYVKEHTGLIGHRRISFYKKIKKLPKVRLISPYEDTFQLIRNSSTVIVLSGSMGWESILFEKPVITLGYAWYDAYDGLFKEGDPKELPTIIKNAINSNPPNVENLKKFVLAVLNFKKEGYVRLTEKDKLLRPENIKALGDALMEKINEQSSKTVLNC
jgi:hypothetical protein